MRRQDKVSALVACGLALAVCGMAMADSGFAPQGAPAPTLTTLSATLANILAQGNTSGTNDIVMAATQEVQFGTNAMIGTNADGVAYIGSTTGTVDGTLQLQKLTFVDPAGAATISTITATEILDVSGSETTTNLIPAGAWNVRACARNTSTIVGTTAVSYTVGIVGGDVDAFGTGIVFTDANSTDGTDWTAAQPGWAAAAREVIVTPDAGTLDTGTIQIVVWYDLLTAQSED